MLEKVDEGNEGNKQMSVSKS